MADRFENEPPTTKAAEGTNEVQIAVFDDDETPRAFVVTLLRSVFGKAEDEADALTTAIETKGKVAFGTYSADAAAKLLRAAQNRIEADGHRLALAAEPISAGTRCIFCDRLGRTRQTVSNGHKAPMCDSCISLIANSLSEDSKTRQFKHAYEALAWHFRGIPQDQLVSITRQFPGHMRADVQAAIDKLFSVSPIRFFGIFEQHRYETLSLAALTKDGQWAILSRPPSIRMSTSARRSP